MWRGEGGGGTDRLISKGQMMMVSGCVVCDRLINIGQMMMGIGVCCARQADQYWSDDDGYRGVLCATG